jgi:hypothetical protein
MIMMKKTGFFIALVTVVFISVYLFAVYENNKQVDVIDEQVYVVHLEKSIGWLQNNRQAILNENNAMLWWMIYEAHKISNDPRLAELLQQYFENYSSIKSSLWGPLFDGYRRSNIDSFSMLNLPYYNKYFIYSLHCTSGLVDELAIISEQNNADFCHQPSYFYRPACITHQLMAVNFLNESGCNHVDNIEGLINDLQQDIVNQLNWDVRVIDVYLQRVMMLLITGAQDEVKPIWIRNILDHQLSDGGWGDFDELINVMGNKSIGFSSRLMSLREKKSSFHATAQGVYILTWLVSKD